MASCQNGFWMTKMCLMLSEQASYRRITAMTTLLNSKAESHHMGLCIICQLQNFRVCENTWTTPKRRGGSVPPLAQRAHLSCLSLRRMGAYVFVWTIEV